MFTLCIPTMERFDNFLSKYLPIYLENPYINEIVITDETGNDVKKIKNAFPNVDKLKLFVNGSRLGPFLNKIRACSLSKNEWIVLIDSDNFASHNYFKIAQEYIETRIGEQKNVILAPSFAKPNFNYSHLNGFIYKNGSFANNNILESQLMKSNNTSSEVLMNTGNYVLNKFLIDNLNLANELENMKYSSACDVIYMNTLMFEQLDLNLHVVEGMHYDHVVHDGSIYTQTHAQFRNFNEYVYSRYRKRSTI